MEDHATFEPVLRAARFRAEYNVRNQAYGCNLQLADWERHTTKKMESHNCLKDGLAVAV